MLEGFADFLLVHPWIVEGALVSISIAIGFTVLLALHLWIEGRSTTRVSE